MRGTLVAVLMSLLPLGAAAQTYQAVNLLNVVPLGGADFEVIEARGEGARGIWCAAADFAEKTLGAGTTAELFIKRGRGASVSGVGRSGVTFTLDSASLPVSAFKSYSVSVDRPGQSLPLGHAIQFCRDYIIEPNDF